MVFRDPMGVMVSGAVCFPRCYVRERNASNCGCDDGERTVDGILFSTLFYVMWVIIIIGWRAGIFERFLLNGDWVPPPPPLPSPRAYFWSTLIHNPLVGSSTPLGTQEAPD